MTKLKCHCLNCAMQYELTYEKQDFIEPEFCAGCGNSDDLAVEEIVD